MQPDRLTDQLAEAQRAEIAELERSVALYGGLLAEYERRLADARDRLADTLRSIQRSARD